MLGNQLFLTAFFELNSQRAYGLEPGPIPWADIHHWCDRCEIDDLDQRDDVLYHVRALDNVYLRETRKKAREESGK